MVPKPHAAISSVGRAPLLVLALIGAACAHGPAAGPDDELRVAVPYDVASLDPHADNSLEGIEQVANVYEPLVALDRELRVVPALAVSWHNPDPSTWVFRLRPGVRFHDGSALRAEDVLHTLERLRSDPSLAIRSQVSELTGVRAEGDSVVLTTGRPSARLLNDLTQVLVIGAGATRETLDARPNGTGPYAVETWTPSERLRLKRHEGYWGPRPRFGRVDVQMGTDDHATAGVQAERLSILRATYRATEEAAERVSRYRILRQPSPYLFHLGLASGPTLPGSDVPNPLRSQDVRRAMDLALDRRRIAAAASPYAVPADGIIPQAIFGSGPAASRARAAPDAAAARRLLAAAGYPDGFDVPLHGVGLESRTALPELRAQLASAGIRVRLVDIPSSPAFQAALRRRDVALWVVADAAVTGEAGWLLETQFHTTDSARNLGTDNFGAYTDAAVDQAIQEANAALKPRVRLPLLQKAVRMVEEQRWWIPLYHNRAPFIVDRSLAFEPRADLYLRYAEIGAAEPPR